MIDKSFMGRRVPTTAIMQSGSGCSAERWSRRQSIAGVPQVFHVHDWQAALIPVYLRTTYAADPVLSGAATVLTIHNAAYQGKFPPNTTEQLLFPWDVFTMDKVEQFDRFNFLKGGVVFADKLTTVSRKYAEEIQTPEFGEQLDGVLRRRAADLHGILNGVDYSLWNPATDDNLAAHYTPENLEGKHVCRADLLHAFGLENVPETTPVIGIVSRLATQKGFDIVAQIAEKLARTRSLWWRRLVPAIPITRIFSATGRSGIRPVWPCSLAMTKRLRTRLRRAQTCS